MQCGRWPAAGQLSTHPHSHNKAIPYLPLLYGRPFEQSRLQGSRIILGTVRIQHRNSEAWHSGSRLSDCRAIISLMCGSSVTCGCCRQHVVAFVCSTPVHSVVTADKTLRQCFVCGHNTVLWPRLLSGRPLAVMCTSPVSCHILQCKHTPGDVVCCLQVTCLMAPYCCKMLGQSCGRWRGRRGQS